MSQIKNISSFLTGGHSTHSSNQTARSCNDEDIVKKGYLAKRKNMKKRYFVLRRENALLEPARLECYDSEKKFKDGCLPKKKYILKDCFNINRKADKNNYVIALYINKDCIGLVAENERDMKDWLQSLQYHKNSSTGHVETRRIDYDHVWQVDVLQRSLATTQNLTGKHWLCLTNRLLSLVRLDNSNVKKEFQLSTIKKCGFLDQFFFLQLGRYSGIGCGELYMQTEDSLIAQNIHNSVGSAMNNFRRTSSLTDSDVRRRTTSDTQEEGASTKCRERADSVPNNPKKHFPRLKLSPSLEKVHQQDSCSSSPCENSSNFCRLNPFPEDPTDEFSRFSDGYVPMEPKRDVEIPNSLGICRSYENSPQGLSSPVSPSSVGFSTGGGSLAVSPSSRTGASEDAYVPMHSPWEIKHSGPTSSSPYANHYVDMVPVTPSSLYSPDVDRNKSNVAVTPSEDSCELFGNSETSSCTSGTSSDHHLPGDSTPYGGSLTTPGGFYGVDDHDCFSGGPRCNRTSSVGSKPEQFKKKTRTDVCSSSTTEPSRARAFSLGSRMTHKFGMGRFGGNTSTGAPNPGAQTEMFPSIKQTDTPQSKNKSSSAPVLDGSLVSHSWSGTPGAYFRSFVHSRNSPRENNLMELDFSKNRSCDVIPSGDKEKERDKKSSRDRLWQTFTGYRNRSNSKSSGSSGSKVGGADWTTRVTSESDSLSRGVEIPCVPNDRRDYIELDFRHSPRSSSSDLNKGYLPMHPPSFLSSSFNGPHPEAPPEKRGPRTQSLNDNYVEMSSSVSSSGSHEGYVDMTQGSNVRGSGSGLSIASSSSSSNSVNSTPVSGRSRRASTNIYVPTAASSQELISPLEDHGEFYKEEGSRKKKKNSRRKSLKETALRRKKSEIENVTVSDALDSNQKTSKTGNSPFSTITNFITRSTSSATKSHTLSKNSSSSLPPKTVKDSPFSSLKRSISREKDLSRTTASVIDSKLNECSSSLNAPALSSANVISTSPPASSVVSLDTKDDIKLPLQPSRFVPDSSETEEKEYCSPKSTNLQNQTTECGAGSDRNYVNMEINFSSPQLNHLQTVVLPSIPSTSASTNSKPDTCTKAEFSKSILFSSQPHQPPIREIKAISLYDEKPNNTERCRSHSGPGSHENACKSSKSSKLVRTASASSSPVSYSPPNSPTMGSQSSMSSLSEGALSSASSTCTVINVGEKATPYVIKSPSASSSCQGTNQ